MLSTGNIVLRLELDRSISCIDEPVSVDMAQTES